MRVEWELSKGENLISLQNGILFILGLSRLGLRNRGGRKPQWRFNKASGKLERSLRGGIDWWRYSHEVLIPKLLPFAVECSLQRAGTLVQEDKAPAHSHQYQQQIYDRLTVKRLLWPGNSPDFNPIEKAWPWMKRTATCRGAPTSKAAMEKSFINVWKVLPQRDIHAWLEGVYLNVE